MNNQRPPSDDLQPGEFDPHTIIPEVKAEHHINVEQKSAPPTFNIWWVDTDGRDRKQKVSADTELVARGVIYALSNCKYIVSCDKIQYHR